MAAGTARVCHDPHVSPSRRSVRALALACLAATVLLGAGAPLASASGGAGTVTSGGGVGQLRINESGLAAVLAFAGQPDAQTVARGAGGRMYDALGYVCGAARQGIEAPVGQRFYCDTAFYIDVRSNTLEQFFTTSRRYHDDHGVHVGMPTAEADGREHRAAIIGCAEGMALRHGHSALVIAMSGGHREGRRRLVGGHVALLAVDSTLRRPGVFVCI
jgi:hypothetical protein